jgi:hypothetical protein
MALYRVELNDFAGLQRSQALVVSAEDATDAMEICKAWFDGDADAAWDNATATAMADVAANAANALVGWRFQCVVTSPAGAIVADAEVTGDATDDTLDEVLTALSTALDGEGLTSTYTGASQSLEVAAAGDTVGDHTVTMRIRPPATNDGADNVHWAGAVSSITHEGAAGAALTVVFAADTVVVPQIFQGYRL